MKKNRLLIGALAFIACLNSFAQSLYGTGVSPEASLIRYVNLDDTEGRELEIGAAALSIPEGSFYTDYYQVSPGMFMIESEGDFLELFAKSGEFYTVVLVDSQYRIFHDTAHKDPVKCQIYFYNLQGESPASLNVVGGPAVLLDVPAMTSEQIAINPIQASFAVSTSSSGEEIGPLPLRRGGSISLFLDGENGALRARLVEAAIQD